MSETNIDTDTKKNKVPKKKGPIRFEAIIPVLVISLLTFAYFSYFFDRHLKSLFEYVATQGNGAEVNIDSVKTSFLKGSFDMNVLQVTDKEKPTHNMIEIENVHFQYLWDALLRMKFVVEDASINNIQLAKPRKRPGHVLPPEPARPSKINQLQNQVLAQVKNKYGANVLGDLVTILEGGDYKAQLETIRGTLKSETRVKAMLTDVNTKKEFWDTKVKTLSDTSKLKEVEDKVNSISKGKNVLEQAKGIKDLNDLLKDVQKQYKEIEASSKQLQQEVKAVSAYPGELQSLVNQDINDLKDRFKIPKLDFKDMAMHLFAGEFVEYIAKARKYQALAKQYIPEKKENKEEIIPRKRNEGENYTFPITTGYPLFWLKRAALSSSGTQDSYSGKVSGELTNVTNAPKQIRKPIKLDMKGDFPTAKIMGVNALITIDHTQAVGKQSAMIHVGSFAVPEKLFVNDKKMKFGFQNAVGKSTVNVSLVEDQINMSWDSNLSQPKFLVETSSSLAKEILGNVLNNIPMISINGSAKGTFTNLDLNITSNLGTELGQGFSREIGLKLADAQLKVKSLIDEKINQPRDQLMSAISGNNKNLSNLGDLKQLYAQNEGRIKQEIEKLKRGGGVDGLKEQGKKIFKGFKL